VTVRGAPFDVVPETAIDGLAADVAPFLRGRGVKTFGMLPRVRELVGVDGIDHGARPGRSDKHTTSVIHIYYA